MIIAVGFIDMNDLRNQKYNEAIKKGYSLNLLIFYYTYKSVKKQFPITSLGKKVIHD
jgi:hypothetical protein